jgi:hypothetical protein
MLLKTHWNGFSRVHNLQMHNLVDVLLFYKIYCDCIVSQTMHLITGFDIISQCCRIYNLKC